MNNKSKIHSWKVGLLVIFSGILLGIMSLKISKSPGYMAVSQKNFFIVPDATGVIPNSAVKVAGIKVGLVDDIVLKDGHAMIVVKARKSLKLTKDTKVMLKGDGILGDKHVALVNGTGAEFLKEGEEISNVQSAGGMDSMMSDFQKISGSMLTLTETLNKAFLGDDTTNLGRLIGNLEKATTGLAEFMDPEEGQFNMLMANLQDALRSVNLTLAKVENLDIEKAWSHLGASLQQMEQVMSSVEEITYKVNSGEGTIGRLLNDEDTIDQINRAVLQVNEVLGTVKKVQIGIDVNSEYLSRGSGTFRNQVGVKMQPGKDRYYQFSLIQDNSGPTETKRVTKTSGGVSTTTEEKTEFLDKYKISAQFAKNVYDFTLRGGLFENSAGLGVDYSPTSKIKLSSEVFGFDDPNLRAYGTVNFLQGAYLKVGGHNLLDSGKATPFVGAGLMLTNDDLKVLASQVLR